MEKVKIGSPTSLSMYRDSNRDFRVHVIYNIFSTKKILGKPLTLDRSNVALYKWRKMSSMTEILHLILHLGSYFTAIHMEHFCVHGNAEYTKHSLSSLKVKIALCSKNWI